MHDSHKQIERLVVGLVAAAISIKSWQPSCRASCRTS